MRIWALALLLVTLSASGQTLERPRRISLFLTPGFGWSEGGGSFAEAGYGVAAAYHFTTDWSAELSIAAEQHETSLLFSDTVFELDTNPIDAVVRYHFLGENSRWRPYLGAGVRYVGAPDGGPPFATYEDRVSAEIAGGTDLNLTDAWVIWFDGKLLLRDEASDFDDDLKISIGIGWRF